MELEILAKVFASQVFKDLIDNIPSNVVLFGLASFIFIKYFLKWNTNRLQNKSSEIKKINSILENTNNLIEKVSKIEKLQKKVDSLNSVVSFKTSEVEKLKFEVTQLQYNKNKEIQELELQVKQLENELSNYRTLNSNVKLLVFIL